MTEPAPPPNLKFRPERLVLLALCVVAGGVLLAWLSGSFRHEPLYKGRAVSYWVDRACLGYDGNNVWSNRLEVKNIGPIAVPYVIERLRTTDVWRSKWNSLRTHLPTSWQKSFPAKPTANEIHYGAARTLSLFGPAAKPAVPDLLGLLPEIRDPALQALISIGPDAKMALPALHAMLKGAIPDVRVEIARALWEIARETNTVLEICTNVMASAKNNLNAPGLLSDLGTAAAPAAPLALSALEDTNCPAGTRANSAIMLGVTRIDTREIRAALLAGTQAGQDENLRCNCAMALWDLDPQYAPLATRLAIEQFADERKRFPGGGWDFTRWLQYRGLDPKESIPTLKQLLGSDSPEVRAEAAKVLDKIEAQTKSGAKQ